jgi:hypothetical protein
MYIASLPRGPTRNRPTPRSQIHAVNARTHGPHTITFSVYWQPVAGWATPPHAAHFIMRA